MAWTYAGAYGPVGLVDNKGNAQTGAEVEVYDIGTSTLATLWESRDKSVQADNPVDVDSNGNVSFFVDPGRYDAVVRRDGIKLYEYEIHIPPDPAEPHAELHKPGGSDTLSGTYRRAVESMQAVNVAEKYGETVTNLQEAITEAVDAGKPLYIDPASAITGAGESVDFTGVPVVLAWASTLTDIRAIIGDTQWWGGRIEQVDWAGVDPLVEFRTNATVYGLDSVPLTDGSFVAFRLRSADGTQQNNINLSNLRDMRKGDTNNGNASFEIRDCRDVNIHSYYARPSGQGDDGLVVKAIEAPTENVVIDGALVHDYLLFGIGDDCGPGIDNVDARNLVGTHAGISLRAGKDTRPGGNVTNVNVQAKLYPKDSIVEQVKVLAKTDGDARLDNINIDVWVYGRFFNSEDNKRNPVMILTESGSRGIGHVNITGGHIDPFDGAPNGADAPGHPASECWVRPAGGQDVDEVVFNGWTQRYARKRAIIADPLGDSGEQVKLLRVVNPIVEEADLDNLGNGWIHHHGGGELDVVGESFGPNAPVNAIQVVNGSTRRNPPYVPSKGASGNPRKSGWHAVPLGGVTTKQWEDGRVSYVAIVVPQAHQLDRLTTEVTSAGTSGSVVRLGIYAAGSDLMPGSLVLDAGTVDSTSTGIKIIDITDTEVGPGVVWLCAVPQGAPSTDPTLRAMTAGASLVPVGPSSTGSSMSEMGSGLLSGSGAQTGALPSTADFSFVNVNPHRVIGRIR